MANIDYQNKATNILKRTREASGKTQEEMARLIGVSDKTIVNWENGKSFPKFPDLIHWFDLLHLDGNIINKNNNDDILLSIRKDAQAIVDKIDRERSLKNEK